jgi:uncharacterized protein YeaO (DUF488 family)
MIHVRVKRVYEPSAEEDGQRYLVDRLWPRGVSKEKAALAGWLKDVAPSAELCAWYGHDPAKWEEFRSRYFGELEEDPPALALIRDMAEKGPVTLVFATKNEELSNARALKEFLEKKA